MEFRWIALLVVWTILIGPVFNLPRDRQRPRGASSAGAAGTPATHLAKE
jgi:hypothetical protein